MSSTFDTCVAELGDSSTAKELVECVSARFDDAVEGVDAFFLIYAASLVFYMQAGFAMLCAGCVRLKNIQNTMLKNLLDACGAALGFYTVGYAFAWGGSTDPTSTQKTFIGTENFFLIGVDNTAFWLFQFAFSATSATIIAGTLAERCQMAAYLCYSIALSAFVYSVVVHSIWSPSGFLSAHGADPLWGVGMIDFAGSCVVHLTGGYTALIASCVLGPRKGRFHDMHWNLLEKPNEIRGHSTALQMLGVFILWFGWYGFNAGSAMSVTKENRSIVVSNTAVATTLSAASGGVAALVVKSILVERETGERLFHLQYAMNGCLSGLVAITAGCAVVKSWAAIIIGLVAGSLYVAGTAAMIKHRIDDAVDAIPVHMVNGIWGSLSVGFFASPELMELAYGNSKHVGLFYSWGHGHSDATLLACQVVGILFVVGWVTVLMVPFFFFLHYLGWLRADSLEEVVGLDVAYTGGVFTKNDPEENNDEYVQAYLARKRDRQQNIFGGDNSASTTHSTHANRGLESNLTRESHINHSLDILSEPSEQNTPSNSGSST